MTCGIYLIENTVSPVFYVGQSTNIEQRWYYHRYYLRRPLGTSRKSRRANRRLWMSWNSHGEDVFAFRVLEECTPDQLTDREIYWLEIYRSKHPDFVCNSEGPADNPMRGRKHSAETKKLISDASSKMLRTDEHRRNIGNAHRGRKLSVEHRRNLSIARTGISVPSIRGGANPSCRPERIAQMLGKNNPVHLPGVIEKMREKNSSPVIDTKTGDKWPSMLACAASLGCSVAAVSAHICGKTKTCKGRRLARAMSPQ